MERMEARDQAARAKKTSRFALQHAGATVRSAAKASIYLEPLTSDLLQTSTCKDRKQALCPMI